MCVQDDPGHGTNNVWGMIYAQSFEIIILPCAMLRVAICAETLNNP